MSSSGSKVVFQSSLAPFMEQFVRVRRAIGYRYEVLARIRACRAHAMKTPRVLPRDGEERAYRLTFSFLVSIRFFKEPKIRYFAPAFTRDALTVLCPTPTQPLEGSPCATIQKLSCRSRNSHGSRPHHNKGNAT